MACGLGDRSLSQATDRHPGGAFHLGYRLIPSRRRSTCSCRRQQPVTVLAASSTKYAEAMQRASAPRHVEALETLFGIADGLLVNIATHGVPTVGFCCQQSRASANEGVRNRLSWKRQPIDQDLKAFERLAPFVVRFVCTARTARIDDILEARSATVDEDRLPVAL
jgi:hypothetical protein